LFRTRPLACKRVRQGWFNPAARCCQLLVAHISCNCCVIGATLSKTDAASRCAVIGYPPLAPKRARSRIRASAAAFVPALPLFLYVPAPVLPLRRRCSRTPYCSGSNRKRSHGLVN
jgi:hypothetical protein